MQIEITKRISFLSNQVTPSISANSDVRWFWDSAKQLDTSPPKETDVNQMLLGLKEREMKFMNLKRKMII